MAYSKRAQLFKFLFGNFKFVRGQFAGSRLYWITFRWDVVFYAMGDFFFLERRVGEGRILIKELVERIVFLVDKVYVGEFVVVT